MKLKSSLLLFTGIIAVALTAIAIIPLVYYSFQLPPITQVTSGASLTSLFGDFEKRPSSVVSGHEISDKISCLVCLPETKGSDGCNALMASFVAKKLLTPESMLFWHLKNAYLSHAIQSKYDNQTLSKLFFASIADTFQQPDIDTVCTKEFNKPCENLDNQELISLQRGISSGKMRSEIGPSDESLKICL